MQRFNNGDLVRVADDLGPSMAHFESGCDAIVIGSYADQYGGRDHDSYTLHLKGKGQCSWYRSNQLTLVERGRGDLLEMWKDEERKADQLHGDLDWIFSNASKVLNGASGSSIAALAGCSIEELWGSRGEGMDYYLNAHAILSAAAPFLVCGDKDGWLSFRDSALKETP